MFHRGRVGELTTPAQDDPTEPAPGEKATGFLGGAPWALLLTAAGVILWLWPLGLGGAMPVGGDVTQFFLGLMGVLSRSLVENRLPIWNDLWGYGFPGIGESQMGVYYPPHLILYRMLPTERAYVASLVLHTAWGALGTWWAARRFGVSAAGAGLAAFAFSAGGFFAIHMPHPWGYTTGSWMPWAWGLTWSILDDRGPAPAARLLGLSLVIVLQLLPGHFQLAFFTLVGIVLMIVLRLVDLRIDLPHGDGPGTTGLARPWGNAALVMLCLAFAFPLAALQVVPTARLARLAAGQRDFDYLSLCATTPLHLVNYVAPGLFHRSPLWRPLVWTPFHTSPEEQLAYVGLIPLFLAILAAVRGSRHDPATRVLTVLAIGTLLLSLGPFVPGFRLLIALPGFSFFRAAARWGLGTSLAVAILAGKGFDACRGWPALGRALAALAILAAFWIGLVVGLVELGVRSGSPGGNTAIAGLFQRIFQARPWTGDPDFLSVIGQARRPASDARIPPILGRAGVASRPKDTRGFLDRRGEIYGEELAETAAVLLGIVALAAVGTTRKGRNVFPAGLILLTFLDLMLLGRHRLVETGPLRPLVEQSPILARLASEPRGERIADGFRNLPMLAGLNPIFAYRTLDLPALEPLTALAHGPLFVESMRDPVRKAMRAAGVGLRVLDPTEVAAERLRSRSSEPPGVSETVQDPTLAAWLFGASWVEDQGEWSTRFRLVRAEDRPAVAWFVPLTAANQPAMLDVWSGDTGPLLELFDRARPLEVERPSSLRWDIPVDTDGEGWVIVTQLADPQWQARWTERDGREARPAEILPAFRREASAGGWQRVRVPGPGRWVLHLEYSAADVTLGLWISAAAWPLWGAVLAVMAARAKSRRRQAPCPVRSEWPSSEHPDTPRAS